MVLPLSSGRNPNPHGVARLRRTNRPQVLDRNSRHLDVEIDAVQQGTGDTGTIPGHGRRIARAPVPLGPEQATRTPVRTTIAPASSGYTWFLNAGKPPPSADDLQSHSVRYNASKAPWGNLATCISASASDTQRYPQPDTPVRVGQQTDTQPVHITGTGAFQINIFKGAVMSKLPADACSYQGTKNACKQCCLNPSAHILRTVVIITRDIEAVPNEEA